MRDETAVARNDVIDVIDVTGLSLSDLDSSDQPRLTEAVRRILSCDGGGRETISGFTNTI